MDTHELAIATMTLARDEAERALILSAFEALEPLDVPVFVTDGGSGRDFCERLRGMPHVHLAKETAKGLWPQTRSSLTAARASGARFVLYTEPDKRDFFRGDLHGFLRTAEENALILAGRSPSVNATFPSFQQYTEGVINRCCSEVTGCALDYSYGPFLMDAALVQRLAPPRDDVGWGWRPYAFGVAHRLGHSFRQVLAAARCPAEQRDESNRVYRMQQMVEGVAGLVLSTKAEIPVPIARR